MEIEAQTRDYTTGYYFQNCTENVSKLYEAIQTFAIDSLEVRPQILPFQSATPPRKDTSLE